MRWTTYVHLARLSVFIGSFDHLSTWSTYQWSLKGLVLPWLCNISFPQESGCDHAKSLSRFSISSVSGSSPQPLQPQLLKARGKKKQQFCRFRPDNEGIITSVTSWYFRACWCYHHLSSFGKQRGLWGCSSLWSWRMLVTTSLVSGSGWLGFVKLYIKALSWALWKNSFWVLDNKHFRKSTRKLWCFKLRTFNWNHMKPVFTSSLLSLRNAGRCCAATLKIRKKESQLMVIDSLGLSFQIKWFTDCPCKPVAMLHSPCVTLCHPVPLCVLSCTWLLWNIRKICCIVLILNVCSCTAEKAHVLHLLLFKGCFAKAYLIRDNDFGVAFFWSSPTSPFLPRCANLCGCKRINREGFALQNVLRLFRNSKACQKGRRLGARYWPTPISSALQLWVYYSRFLLFLPVLTW